MQPDQYTPSPIQTGDRVTIGDNIEGVVEELIFSRGMNAPFVLVEYWHEGSLISRRFHAEDCRKVGA